VRTKIQSEETAERNHAGFKAVLQDLKARQGGGIEYYEVRGSCFNEYDPVTDKFYRRAPVYGKAYLTAGQEDELMEEVGLGVVDVYITSLHNEGKSRRVWHGEFNIKTPTRKYIPLS